MAQAPQGQDHGKLASAGARDSAAKSYNHPCLIARTLDVLGDRWTLLILRDLMAGLNRYTDILENCPGMSPNVLSNRLKRLEAEGLVQRIRHKELPPRVEYLLTNKGRSVRPILLSLLEWGAENVGPFEAERTTTDFAVRTLPTFFFNPEHAADLSARMVIEISDCSDCNTWTFEIHDGHIHPRRFATEGADIYLKTSAQGFMAFIHGKSSAEEVGELSGSAETAAAIQACFDRE